MCCQKLQYGCRYLADAHSLGVEIVTYSPAQTVRCSAQEFECGTDLYPRTIQIIGAYPHHGLQETGRDAKTRSFRQPHFQPDAQLLRELYDEQYAGARPGDRVAQHLQHQPIPPEGDALQNVQGMRTRDTD